MYIYIFQVLYNYALFFFFFYSYKYLNSFNYFIFSSIDIFFLFNFYNFQDIKLLFFFFSILLLKNVEEFIFSFFFLLICSVWNDDEMVKKIEIFVYFFIYYFFFIMMKIFNFQRNCVLILYIIYIYYTRNEDHINLIIMLVCLDFSSSTQFSSILNLVLHAQLNVVLGKIMQFLLRTPQLYGFSAALDIAPSVELCWASIVATTTTITATSTSIATNTMDTVVNVHE